MLSRKDSTTARSRLPLPRAVPVFPRYSPRERHADALVHAVGLIGGSAACLVLAALSVEGTDPRRLVSLGLYATGLMAMLICSALYNLSVDGPRKALFQRLDHAAIFMMIAGTYTPFTLVAIGGAWGTGLCAFVWMVAVMGMAVEILGLSRSDNLLVAAYLLLGWVIVIALGPLAAALSPAGMTLLVAGGVLYTVGVVFHLWTRLPYQNAIWHGFVLLAASSHYAAVLLEIAA
ncbi:PAQR family membrane homeostasis protein TrhA [Benzoatithermus flavus]|uniref:Hemolysin III family protein n=1 Tax=Benzoatithermus flavus TaxID=3108223 RepID=A0ABU8XRI4_9PROT